MSRVLLKSIQWTGIAMLSAGLLWAGTALTLFPAWPVAARMVALAVYIACGLLIARRTTKWVRIWGLVALGTAVRLLWELNQPSQDRPWSWGNERLALAHFAGEIVEIENVRNLDWKTRGEARWETRRYDLRELRSVDFLVAPFAFGGSIAHTFVSFGFDSGEHLAVSVEARKEKGESFSPIKGLFRQYELKQ